MFHPCEKDKCHFTWASCAHNLPLSSGSPASTQLNHQVNAMSLIADAFSVALDQMRGNELEQETQNALRIVLDSQDQLLRTAVGLVFITQRRELLQRPAKDCSAEALKRVGRKLQADAEVISRAARSYLDEASSYGYLLAGMWLESAALNSAGGRAAHETLERLALRLENALAGDSAAAQPQDSSLPGKIVIECPSCRQRLRVRSGANLVATCPKCQTNIDLDSNNSKTALQ